MIEKPRWLYRFDNYKRAFILLREAMEREQLNQLEQEGVIQRFEYTMELAWKTLKDYLEHQGVVLEQATPRVAIRHAFEAGIIENGEVWQHALDARNKMSHTYNFESFEHVIADIRKSYLAQFEALYEFLLEQAVR